MRLRRGSSIPAADSMVRIFGSLACHQRRWSFLSSLMTTAGVPERRFLKLICMLNCVQSGNRDGPVPLSANTRRVRTTVSGPLVGPALLELAAPGVSAPCSAGSLAAASWLLASALECDVALLLGSRGCAPVRGGCTGSGYLHLPNSRVCPASLARGFCSFDSAVLHVGQSYGFGAILGHLQFSGFLECIGLSLLRLLWQAGHPAPFGGRRLGASMSSVEVPAVGKARVL